MKCPGAIRDEEIDKLQLQFTCHGCGRPEANMLCKWGHERHCPYVQLITAWVNSTDPDGEWEVTKLLDVRGPPERRFWKVRWGNELTDAVAGTDGPLHRRASRPLGVG